MKFKNKKTREMLVKEQFLKDLDEDSKKKGMRFSDTYTFRGK